MSSDHFKFRQFTIRHDRCAMKVGTDGVLLGALAACQQPSGRILDIGTGSGLVALMMAQRFPLAAVTGIDIDHDACRQAADNAAASPFADRISIMHASLQDFTDNACETYDSIVCNPPFFEETVECPDSARNVARHTAALPYSTLLSCSRRLLADGGTMTVILPTDRLPRIEEEGAYAGLFVNGLLHIRTVERKPARRTIVTLGKTPTERTAVTRQLMEGNERSPWYREITKDFYL